MQQIRILFFGSTSDSVIVLDKLSAVSSQLATVTAVVTQPARPVGRKQILTPTPVEIWAKEHNITCLTFASNPEKPWLYADEAQVIDALEPCKADLIISASYGQKIPSHILSLAKFGGLNIHPSILPRWRGGDPVPWAIMTGDHQVGVTIVSLSDKFDEGLIYGQEKIPVSPEDTSTPLRTKLFGIGADMLVALLPEYLAGKAKGKPQLKGGEPRATRLSRDIGFEAMELLQKAFTDQTEAERIERKYRALSPWPGVWTRLPSILSGMGGQAARLKILKCHLNNNLLVLDEVQLEGKNPVTWEQLTRAYNLA
jgi:methionyl-tRNA formyltransferase